MRKLICAVLLGLCLLCLQSAVWATIPGHIMLDYISDAYPLNDGVLVGFAYKTVSASTADTGSNIFYIEEPDRSSGIKVYWMGSLPQPARNHCVVVGGTLWTMNGERQICLDYLLDLGNNPAITPLGMDNNAVGGMSFNALTPGITDALGPYNKGLLIRAWGYVQASDDIGRYFYIDDGSGLSDGSGSTGVRVSARSGITLPSVGDYVVVTGISSTYEYGGGNHRMVIARAPADIVAATPTTLESKDAVAPGTNIVSLPGVPYNDGSSSATPSTVFANTYPWAGYRADKWNPANQDWWDASSGANAVYSDEGYRFLSGSSTVLDPTNGAIISYQAVLGILEQTDRYIPLYAGSNGANWIGYPFRTGSDTNRATVANGARIYPTGHAANLNWIERYGQRYDNLAQTSVQFDTAATDVYRPWMAYRITSKRPCAMIIPAPLASVQMLDRPDHIVQACDIVPIQARVTNASGTPLGNIPVTFTATSGLFVLSNGATVVANTNSSGIATVDFRDVRCGIAGISATAPVSGRRYASQVIHVTVDGVNMQLSLDRFAAHVYEPIGVVAKLTHCDQATPYADCQVRLTTDAGTFANNQTTLIGQTDANGELRTTLTVSSCPATAMVTAELLACVPGVKDSRTVIIDCDAANYDNWPMFMHDAQHTGLSKTWDSGSADMTHMWSVNVPTCGDTRGTPPTNHPDIAGGATMIFAHPYIDSSPVVVGNRVVVGAWDRGSGYDNSSGSVRAYDAETGQPAWQTPQIGGVASTPCISGNYVFVGSGDGKLYCIDLTSGSIVWSRQTTDRSTPAGNSKILSSPVVYNGIVYITNEASKIYAYSANSAGTLLTGYPIVLPITDHGITAAERNVCGASSPAIARVGSYIYLLVGSDDGYVYRLRLSDRQLQSIFTGGCVESSPSVNGNSGVVGVSWYMSVSTVRFSIEPFKTLGQWNLMEESRATVSIASNGHLYNGVDTGRTLFKLDKDTVGQGTPLERYDVNWGYQKYFVGSAAHLKAPQADDGFLYSGNDNGRLYCLRDSDLGLVWMHQFNPNIDPTVQSMDYIASSPALAYNVDAEHNRWMFITCRTGSGQLHAFKNVTGSCNLELTYPGDPGPCDNTVVISGLYTLGGVPAADMAIEFTTSAGTFAESGTDSALVYTDANGVAQVTLQRPSTGNEADVTASSACDSDALHVVFGTYTLNLTASPSQTQPGRPADLTVTLTDADASPAAGETVNLTTTAGVFADGSTSLDAVTDTNGEVHTTLTFSGCPEEATVTATYSLTCTSYSDSTTVKSVADMWTSFQGDNRNSGVTVSYLGASMVKKWSMPITGNYDTEIWSSPIALGNSVWVATNSANGTVYRFLSDGTVMATRNLGSPVIGTPCLDPSTGTLYVGTQEGVLHSMNATNLNPNWSFNCYNSTEEIWSSPKLSNGAVYFVSTDATNNVSYLYIVDASGGYEWSTPAQMGDEVVYSTPSIDETNPYGGRVYAAGSNGHVAAFGIYGGTYWEVQGGEHCYYSSPVVSTDRILIGNCNKEFGVYPWMDTGSTATLSKFEGIGTDDRVFATPAVYDGKIAFGTNIVVGSAFWFADQATWGLDWRTPLLDSINTSALICPSTGLVFSASIAGRLYGFALGDGLIDWNFDIRADLGSQDASVKSSFAAADDKMYIVAGTANARYLYCFGAP